MPPLHLPCHCQRPWSGEDVFDAVLSTYPIKQHLTATRPEPAGEHLAVISQDLLGHPISPHCFGQRVTSRPCYCPPHHMNRDHKPGMIINPRHDARFPATSQHHPTHHIHLPQLHRPTPFPTPVISLLTSPHLRLDQAMTNQTPIHQRTARQRIHTPSLQLKQQHPRPPRRPLHDQRLHHPRHLIRTRPQHRRLIHQPRQAPRTNTTTDTPSNASPHISEQPQ